MRTHGTTNRTALADLGRRALAAWLTLSMVLTNVPMAYAVEALGDGSDAQAAPTSETIEAVETTKAGTNDGKGTDAPAQAEVVPPDLAAEVVTAPDGEEDEAQIGFDFGNAYIHYRNQVIGSPTTTLAVPAGEPFAFSVTADEGYELDEVKTTLDGVEKVLAADGNGLYEIDAASVRDGLLLSVSTTEDPFVDATSSSRPIDEKRNEQAEFTFEDGGIRVTATLADPSVLPAGATFRVTQITRDSTGYNYDAYMAALNRDAAEGTRYDEGNTLMYDFAFLVPKGNGGEALSDEWVEVQLDESQVRLDIQFKDGQLEKGIGATDPGDIEINHLPLRDSVRSSYDTTADATDITPADVIVETPARQAADPDGESARVEATSLSPFTITNVSRGATVTVNLDVAGGIELGGNDHLYLFATLDKGGQGKYYYFQPLDVTQAGSRSVDLTGAWRDQNNNPASGVRPENGNVVDVTVLGKENGTVDFWSAKAGTNSIRLVNGTALKGVTATYGEGQQVEVGGSKQYSQSVTITQTRLNPVAVDMDAETFLGNAMYFGVVADEWHRPNDAETNAAVNRMYNADGQWSGNGHDDKMRYTDTTYRQPWFVGWVEGKTYIKKDHADVYTPLDQQSKFVSQTSGYLTFHTTDASAVESYIDTMLDYTKAQSDALIGLSSYDTDDVTIAREPDGTQFAQKIVIDLTGRPDGTYCIPLDATIDDGSTTLGDFVGGGDARLIIKKTSDQVVVFNSARTGTLHMNQWYVINDGRQLDCGSIANGNTQENEDAATSVIWNLPNATRVDIDGAVAGIIYAPNAAVHGNKGVGAGWLIADSFTNTGIEWHYIWQHFDHGYAKAFAQIDATKMLDGAEPGDKRFSFQLTDGSGNVIQTKENDASGNVTFQLAYAAAGEFDYVVSEVDQGEQGITYDTATKRVHVKVTKRTRQQGNLTIHEYVPEVTYLDGTIAFNNTTSTTAGYGSLRVRKVVTEGGSAPTSAYAKARLAGEYSFGVYTDEACTTQARDRDGNVVSTRITIGTDGQAVTSDEITGLPEGDYWVREDDPHNGTTGHGTAVRVHVEADKVGDQAALATVTNDYDYGTGGLVIAKAVDSDIEADRHVSYDFKMTITSNDVISGTYGALSFAKNAETGKYEAEFSLDPGEGETVRVTGLPEGVAYRIEENLSTEQVAIFGEHAAIEGVISTDEQAHAVTFTNTRKTGEVTISKIVSSGVTADRTKVYRFAVQLKDGDDNAAVTGDYRIKGTGNTVHFEGGATTVEVRGGASVTIEGLPVGLSYEVTETAESSAGFEVEPGSRTGAIAETGSTAAFTNTRKTGDLTISKSVVSDAAADRTKAYEFGIQLKDGSRNATVTGDYRVKGTEEVVHFEGGTATVEVRGGASVTIEGLPAGLTYEITETAESGEGFVVAPETATGAIAMTGAAASFTNTKKSGIVISKEVVSPVPADKGKTYSFKIKLGDATINATYSEVTFRNGEGSFTIEGEGSKLIEGLPAGTTYEIEEVADGNFNVSSDKATGRIEDGTTHAVRFTNTRKTGALAISKSVVSGVAADRTKTYEFGIRLKDGNENAAVTGDYRIKGTNGTVHFDGGTATVEVRGGASVTIEGLPVGLSYEVTETAASGAGFDVTSDKATGDVAEGTATAAFTNTRETGDLAISKSVVSGVAADRTKAYEFAIQLKDGSRNATVTGDYRIKGTEDAAHFEGGAATIEVRGGTSVTIEGLPAGLTYVVTEAEETAAGSVFTVGKEADTGDIVADGTATAAFTNTRKAGDLTVSKRVVSDVPDDQGTEFEFTVTLTPAVAGEYEVKDSNEKVTFDGTGKATIRLTGGQSKTIVGLPYGVGYAVSETPHDDFIATDADQDGTILPGATAAFTNTRIEKGDLLVSKSVESDVPADHERQYLFTVTVEPAVSGTYGDMTFDKSGKSTFTLTDQGSKVARGLPARTRYTVTENLGTGTNLRADALVKSGTISDRTESRAQFVNTRDTGSIEISKSVVSPIPAEQADTYLFDVQLLGADGTSINATYGEGSDAVTFHDGLATVAVQGGHGITIDGLPKGIAYAVTEHAYDHMDVTPADGHSGTVGQSETAAFTNRHQTTSLDIEKQVASDVPADHDRDYTFEIDLHDETINQTFECVALQDGNETDAAETIRFAKGVGEVTIHGDGTKRVKGLPVGVTYTVSEKAASQAGFSQETTGATATLAAGTVAKAVVRNIRAQGDLKVTKTVVSHTQADKERDFQFTVTLTGLPITKTFGSGDTAMAFEGGTARFTLHDGQEKVATGLPAGIEYTVEETDGDGFTAVYTNASGAIPADDVIVAEVENSRQEGELSISKQVVSKVAADNEATYTFDIQLTPKRSGTYGEVAFDEDGKGTVEIVGSGTKVVPGLPKGTGYVVTERVTAGSNLTASPASATGKVGEGQGVLFTNTRDEGSLTVSKSVESSTAADKGQGNRFEFTVTLGEELDGWFGGEDDGMLFVGGTATFELANGESRTATGLPAGISYEVTETEADGYDVESSDASGTIAKDTEAKAAFTNKRREGALEVTKTVREGIAADDDTEFEVSVDLHDATLNNTYGTGADATEFKGGVATFKLTNGETRTIGGLPAGTTYTVTETAYDGFETTYEGQVADAIAKGDTNHVDVANTRQYGSLAIRKLVTVDHRPAAEATTLDRDAADGTYRFKVTGPGMPEEGQVVAITVTHGQSATRTLEHLQTGEYVVEEVTDGLPKNMSLMPAGPQRLVVTADGETEVSTATFVNDLSTTSATLRVTKDFDYWDTVAWPAGETQGFAFTLRAVDGAPMPSSLVSTSEVTRVATDGSPVDFGTIAYGHEGTYHYTINEVVPEGAENGRHRGISYDTSTHRVTVHVAADEDGVLHATTLYDGKAELVIENGYEATGETTLKATKAIDGRAPRPGDKWRFTVSQPEGQDAPMPEHADVVLDATQGFEVDFGKITGFTLEDAGRSYTYVITESDAEDAGVPDITNDAPKQVVVSIADNGDGTLSVTSDAPEGGVAFTNTYVVSKGLVAQKGIANRSWKTNEAGDVAEDYTFLLTDSGASSADLEAAKAKREQSRVASQATTQGPSHQANFGTFSFTTEDAGQTFAYDVREEIPAGATRVTGDDGVTAWVKDGVRYSDFIYTVTYSVFIDADGELQVTEEYRQGESELEDLRILNEYHAEGTDVTIEAGKVLRGRDVSETDDFKFELVYVPQAGQERVEQTKGLVRNGDGTYRIRFAAKHYTTTAEEDYVIREVVPQGAEQATDATGKTTWSKDGVTYDATPHKVHVSVTDDLSGHLRAAVTYDGGASAPTFENTYFGATADIEFDKEFYGASEGSRFSFVMTAVDDEFAPRASEGGTIGYDADDAIVDDGQAFTVTAHNEPFDGTGARVRMPSVTYHRPGTYRYVITETDDGTAVSTDATQILVTVVVDGEANARVTYQTRADGVTSDVPAGERPVLYNNGLVSMAFRSRALRATAAEDRVASYAPAVRKVLRSGILRDDQFSFSLYAGDEASGTPLDTATNDANGTIAFDGISYGAADAGKTFTYTIVEDAGSDETIVYDGHEIRLEVAVSQNDRGELEVNASYHDIDDAGTVTATDDPTFTNAYDTIIIHAVKRSREEPYDPLPGAHYGLWMVNPDGEDVYMGLGRNQKEQEGSELVSSDTGDLYYDIPLLEGVAYYFREEWPPPAGHLVDPYPTDYFTLVHDKENGRFRLVYEADPDFSEYCPGITR